MTRADLKHCGKIPDAREELNRSVRVWKGWGQVHIVFLSFFFNLNPKKLMSSYARIEECEKTNTTTKRKCKNNVQIKRYCS